MRISRILIIIGIFLIPILFSVFVYSFCCGGSCYASGLCLDDIWYPCGCNDSLGTVQPPGALLGECLVCKNESEECSWKPDYENFCFRVPHQQYQYLGNCIEYCNVTYENGAPKESQCIDRDFGQSYCTSDQCKNTTWSKAMESVFTIEPGLPWIYVYEYNPLIYQTETECCGDDVKEYFIDMGSISGCCDNLYDIINETTGLCQQGNVTGSCGDGIAQLYGPNGNPGDFDDEQCDDGPFGSSRCTPSCTLILKKALIVDFNGPNEYMNESWINGRRVEYPLGDNESGWIPFNEIVEFEDPIIGVKEGLFKLLADYHEFNSTFGLSIVNASYNITYIVGGNLNGRPSTGKFSIMPSDILGNKTKINVGNVSHGELAIITQPNVILHEIANFTFSKEEQTGLGVINGIIFECNGWHEIEHNGLDDDCDGLVDEIPDSYIQNRIAEHRKAIVILGVQQDIGEVEWVDYAVVYNSTLNMTNGTIQFEPSEIYWEVDELWWIGGGGEFNISEAGSYRVYAEFRNPDYGLIGDVGTNGRFFSASFTVT